MSKKTNTVSRVAVLDKTFKIIFFLEESKTAVGLTEISRKTEINKATCYRILQTLTTYNIIETGEQPGTYQLGIGLLKLGETVQRRINVREIALPYLKELTNNTDITSYLCILHHDKSLCVERIEGSHAKILLLNVGDEWPLHIGGAPRAMLAYLEEEKIEDILSNIEDTEHTEHASNVPSDYQSILQSVRETGYNTSYDDVLSGISSIGAPIFNQIGDVVAAVSLSNISSLIHPDTENVLAEQLLKTTNKISRALGYGL